MLLTVEWNPRGLVFTVAAAGALWLAIPYLNGRQCNAEDSETSSSPPLGASLPDIMPAGDVAGRARSAGAVAGYDYVDGDTPMRAFVFEERPGWYTLVYYSGDGHSYSRVEGTYKPTGFGAPRMIGSPPLLAFHSDEMNEDFAFRLRDGRMELEALGGASLEPGVPVQDPSLPGLVEHRVTREEEADDDRAGD